MKTPDIPPPGDTPAEVSKLIETLHATSSRLEELTAGEVDAVADREGNTLLLRGSQEGLRLTEAARQAAILDVLPASIALLDDQGVIVSVNEAWRVFAKCNALRAPGQGLGLNYLEVCDRASSTSAEARQAAAGIRDVLYKGALQFSLEYPCHSPTTQRWFLMLVAPLAPGVPGGAAIMHLDISERQRDKDQLRESERRFSDMLGNVELLSLMLDRAGRITYCNDYLLRLTGWERDQVMGRDWFEMFVPIEREDVRAGFAALMSDREFAPHYENEILTRSGERRLIRWNNSMLRSGAGEVTGTASIGEDITERTQAEVRFARLNRVHAVLSEINALIVRVEDRERLFHEACRIAVDAGAFQMAWIGVIDPLDRRGHVAACHGADPGYLETVRFSAPTGSPGGESPATRAMREKRPVICNDIATDSEAEAIRVDALKWGSRSFACFPLMVADRAVAVFVLFSVEADDFDDEETRLLLGLTRNISFALNHLEKSDRLTYLAYYDVLTGLANRSLFLERVAQYVRSAAEAGHGLAVLVTDIEGFKNINDSLGPAAGDELLRQVTAWLELTSGSASLLARVGADQFAIVMPRVAPEADLAAQVEESLRSLLLHPFRLDEAVLRIAAKAGVAVFPRDGADAATLFRNAEAALKSAKAGNDRFRFYVGTMTEAVAVTLTLENRLRVALEQGEFVLHFQPKFSLADGKLAGAEALIRWADPGQGLVPPGQFIAILEKTGLIHEVGRWALGQAIEVSRRWRGTHDVALPIAVNVSPVQLRDPNFIVELGRALALDPRAAPGLELEITESVVMENVNHSIAILGEIRALGVAVAIDDFGTGFSSLSYLSRLQADTLKIDRTFVNDMTVTPEGLALVSTIINLAHALKLKVVAEGVETEEQSRLLRLLHCDEAQGFLFGRPVPLDDFASRYLAPGPATSGGP